MCPQQPKTLHARIPSLQRHIQTHCTPSFKQQSCPPSCATTLLYTQGCCSMRAVMHRYAWAGHHASDQNLHRDTHTGTFLPSTLRSVLRQMPVQCRMLWALALPQGWLWEHKLPWALLWEKCVLGPAGHAISVSHAIRGRDSARLLLPKKVNSTMSTSKTTTDDESQPLRHTHNVFHSSLAPACQSPQALARTNTGCTASRKQPKGRELLEPSAFFPDQEDRARASATPCKAAPCGTCTELGCAQHKATHSKAVVRKNIRGWERSEQGSPTGAKIQHQGLSSGS